MRPPSFHSEWHRTRSDYFRRRLLAQRLHPRPQSVVHRKRQRLHARRGGNSAHLWRQLGNLDLAAGQAHHEDRGGHRHRRELGDPLLASNCDSARRKLTLDLTDASPSGDGLFLQSGHWYLVGRDVAKDAVRNFRDGDAEEAIVEFRGASGAVKAAMKLGAPVMSAARHQRGFQVRRIEVFARWLLSFALPIAPAQLVDAYREIVRQTLAVYAEIKP